MKRKKITRLASILFALVLVTTCVISGTFAKYITQASTDGQKAKVAKWGVTVSASGKLFDETYLKATDNTPNGKKGSTGTVSVEVEATGTNLVAPGTKSYPETDTENAFKISITGEPEVAVKVSITTSDSSNETKDVNLDNKYFPVKFKLWQKNVKADKYVTIEAAGETLTSITNYLTNLGKDKTFEPNTNLGETYGDFIITWEWPIGTSDEVDDATNKNDTLLGDYAANKTIEESHTYNIEEVLSMKISVTQED